MLYIIKHLPICSTRGLIFLSLIFICIFLHVKVFDKYINVIDDVSIISAIKFKSKVKSQWNNTKYILAWNESYLMNGKDENKFRNLNCSINNCLLTGDKLFLGDDYTHFDAIIFDELVLNPDFVIPRRRSNSQLYIFHTIESAFNLPSCELKNDNFFNWTFTYRLDSDITWNYLVVRNRTGAVVAPSATVEWENSTDHLKPEIKIILSKKCKPAVWLVSHCRADSFRDDYLLTLQQHLFHYSLQIDIYGKCSKRKCIGDCDDMIKNNYFFYMAFENSFSEDYVTEKVLHGYDNYAVPIVYGDANYSRFLPSGSYINARKLHPYNLAFLIYQAVNVPSIYQSYFKWTNVYTIEAAKKQLHPLCGLCAALNSERATNAPAKKEFRHWWNGLNGMKWCLSDGYWNETANVNVDLNHIFNVY